RHWRLQLSIIGSQPEIPRRYHWYHCRVSLVGERSVCKQYRSLPCQLQHAALYCSAACLPSKTQHTVKHTQHTVNPLIASDVNPFLPSVISTVSVLLALITVLVS
ncbi:unnamed protein product, partial [Staurois parvus]